jgi:c-di-GMP-related signal transduction protein
MTTTGLPVTDVGGERGSLFVVGRQAIYDASMAVHGYELLYRGEEGQRPSGRQMTAEVLVHAGLDLGLWGLTMGKPAFVNATRAFLVGELQVPFSPNQVVIEVLGDVPRDAEVLKGCRRLAQKGYTLAIDDYLWGPEDDPLLELAPVVKLDVLALSLAELRAAVRRCSAHGVRLAAKKVETDAQLRQYGASAFRCSRGTS